MSSKSSILPFEVLDVVASFLVSDDAYGTCANLNVASHAVYDATLKTLWTHMCWMADHSTEKYDEAEIKAKWDCFSASPGAKFVRYLFEMQLDPNGDIGRRLEERNALPQALAPTVEVSVTLLVELRDERTSSPVLLVHLLESYKYTSCDMARLWFALNWASSQPCYKTDPTQPCHIILYIHAKDSLLDKQDYESSVSSSQCSETNIIQPQDDSHQQDNNASPTLTIDTSLCRNDLHPTYAPKALPHSIMLYMEDCTLFEEEDYVILWTHIMNLLQPYASARLASGARPTKDAYPHIYLEEFDHEPMRALITSLANLSALDAAYATIHIDIDFHHEHEDLFELAYEADYGSRGILTLLDSLRLMYISAAQTRGLVWRSPSQHTRGEVT